MSIVQEALKRAQYDYAGKKNLPQAHKESGQEPVIPATVETPDVRIIIKKIAVIVYVIVLLALVTGFGIRALFSKIVAMDKERKSKDFIAAAQKTPPDQAVPSPIPPVAVERVTEKPPASASSEQINQAPNFVLNGIMYIEERPKAIINGTVVRKGDVINGATITSITEKNVLLKYNNNDNQVEMTLKLKE